jgi:hypothetical protein
MMRAAERMTVLPHLSAFRKRADAHRSLAMSARSGWEAETMYMLAATFPHMPDEQDALRRNATRTESWFALRRLRIRHALTRLRASLPEITMQAVKAAPSSQVGRE